MFSKYSNEDINSLTADEILNYINLYGSYTGKDLIKELGLQKVKDNIDSFKGLTNFEDILYEAEEYYGYSSESDTSDDSNKTSNSDKTSNDDKNNKIPDKSEDSNKDNMNEFEDNPQHDRDNEFSGNNPNKDKLQENNSTDKMLCYDESNKNNFDRNDNYSEDSNKNTNENNNKLPSNTSTSSNTGDTSNLLLALSGIIGLLGIKKRR